MVDLNRFSDADLLALYAGDLDKMSNAGLMLLAGHEPKQSTVIGEAKRGTEQLLSSSLAGIKGIFYPEEAAQEELKRQEKQYDPPMTETEEYLLKKQREEEYKSYDY